MSETTNKIEEENIETNTNDNEESSASAAVEGLTLSSTPPSSPTTTIPYHKTNKPTNYVPEGGSNAKLENDDPNWQPEEEIAQDSRSLVFSLVKQVKIGMDLSRVVLPTFILEPRSMLEKVSDYLTHCELLADAAARERSDPLSRIIAVTKWYLSGYYIKPKGVKKPYNPVLGEFFRSMWIHPQSKTKTFFVSEQVSHHPPISAFYASNRKEGFVINGSILFKSRFMGTSVGSILDGFATLHLLNHDNESYDITFPSAYAKGFLFGTLVMELAGQVTITCKQTGYKAELDFKQKPLIGGGYNFIAGRIKQGNNILYTLQGKWDSRIDMYDVTAMTTELLWEPSEEVKRNRLARNRVPKDEQDPFESERLWDAVSKAISRGDQKEATDAKADIEQAQREAVKQRDASGIVYKPRLFQRDDSHPNHWVYKHFNTSVWNPSVETEEFEIDGVIQIKLSLDIPSVDPTNNDDDHAAATTKSDDSVAVNDDKKDDVPFEDPLSEKSE